MESTRPDRPELVVLLHGILRSKTDMIGLAAFLRRNGYATANILYPSRKLSIEQLADYVAEKIDRRLEPGQTLHFVVHSLGGLIARYYIEKYRPQNLGKVVMLSPPNTGSEFADALLDNKILSAPYRKIFGPAAPQLSTRHRHTGRINFPLGIIAGTQSINPLAPFFIPKSKVGPHDGIVPVERTKIPGMADHLALPVNHTFMMFDPRVMRETLHFLKFGNFSGESAAERTSRPASSEA